MELKTVLFRDHQPNFLNLSLLICNLFAGGNFRMAHILYYPEVFDDRLLNAITTCLPQIPLMTTDISAIKQLSPNHRQSTDRILQLIFMPRNNLNHTMFRLSAIMPVPYRIYIFHSNQDPGNYIKEWVLDYNLKLRTGRPSSLILIHNVFNGAFKQYVEPIEHPLPKTLKNRKQNLSLMPVDFWEEQPIGIIYLDKINCRSYNSSIFRTLMWKDLIRSRFYFSRFNMSFLREVTLYCEGYSTKLKARYVQPIRRSTFDDLLLDFRPDSSNKGITNRSAVLYFNYYPLEPYTAYKKTFVPFNAYKMIDVYVIYVYGLDSPRQFNYVNKVFLLCALIFVFAIILYCMRRCAAIRRVSFMVGYLEVYSVVFGGGNIQYQHFFERLFFAAALAISFFLVPIYLADYTMNSILREPLKMDTFDKLAEQDIFYRADVRLFNDQETIAQMLSEKLSKKIYVSGKLSATLIFNFISRDLKKPFAIVTPEDFLNMYKSILFNENRDYDIVKDSLGSVPQNFYLASYFNVAQKVLEKFNQMSMSLIENGWFQFIESYDTFLFQLKTRTNAFLHRHEDDFHPITLDEFKYSIILYTLLVVFVSLVFIGEIIWFHLQHKWRRFKQTTKQVVTEILLR